MLLYNITIIIEDTAVEEWLKWMQDTHIPAVLKSGKFVSHRLLKVLDSPNEGTTYCVQYVTKSLENYENYQQNYAPALQAELQQKFENRHVAFRTLMQYVD